MKTTILMAAMIASVAVTAGMAQAQGRGMQNRPDFAALDTNGDGALTQEEIEARGAEHFAAADTDADGALSVEELVAHMAVNAPDRATAMLERLDENGDGLLQQAEMHPQGGDRLGRMFAFMDEDEDGAVTEAEFEAARDHHGRRGHEGKGPRGRH